MRRASSVYQRNWSTESAHSRRDWASGLPDSNVIRRAASSVRSCMILATACRRSARAQAEVDLQTLRPASAAAMAASTSALSAAGTVPTVSPVAGSTTSSVPWPPFVRQAPSMNRPRFSYIAPDPHLGRNRLRNFVAKQQHKFRFRARGPTTGARSSPRRGPTGNDKRVGPQVDRFRLPGGRFLTPIVLSGAISAPGDNLSCRPRSSAIEIPRPPKP